MQLAKDVGIPDSDILKWDIEETKKGSYSAGLVPTELANFFFFFNCRWSFQGDC